MNGNPSAEERVDLIRGLIERGEIYRDVFARGAFVGSALSILTACAIFVNDEVTRFLDRPVRPREFAFAWLDVFFLTAVVTALFLWRASRDNADVFISARMKLVLRTMAPCLLIPMAFTSWFFTTGYLGAAELDLVVVWIVLYGLMLLSTALFAPRSIAILGWAFLLTGLSVPLLADKIDNWIGSPPTVLMGVAFGVYHLIFAVLTWLQQKPKVSSADFAD
jgi:hypothetical protein